MNINSINPLSLPSVPLKDRRSLPTCPAIYFVLAGERILYIGRSVNLAQRWVAHHRCNQLLQLDTSARIAWLECSEVQLLNEIEAALIKQFDPELNGDTLPTGMSKKARMTVSLEPEIYQQLAERAKREGRTAGNLAAFLLSLSIEQGLDQAEAKGKED